MALMIMDTNQSHSLYRNTTSHLGGASYDLYPDIDYG